MKHAQANRWKQRGGAMVETAVLLLVLVPVLTYTFFLADAAYLKLDLQEAAVSGAWDFSTRNTESFYDRKLEETNALNNLREVAATAQAIRVAYADHTSAFDDGADPAASGYGSADRLLAKDGHHRFHHGFGAELTRNLNDGEDVAVQCEVTNEDTDWMSDAAIRDYARSGYVIGGQIQCGIQANIFNYIIPESFAQGLSKVEMTSMTKYSREANGLSPSNHDSVPGSSIPLNETAAISFNTWALRNGSNSGSLLEADVGARETLLAYGQMNLKINPLYQRVAHLYMRNAVFGLTYEELIDKVGILSGNAAAQQLVVIPYDPYGYELAEDPIPNATGVFLVARYYPPFRGLMQPKPEVVATTDAVGFQSTPYLGINGDYVTAGTTRGTYYMGTTASGGGSLCTTFDYCN